MPIPILYVEGRNDISVISALLKRHGIDTQRGKIHLCIKEQETLEQLLFNIPLAAKNATDFPVGFVVDIDIEVKSRWDAVCGRLKEVGVSPPSTCPAEGYIGQIPDYPFRFGVWLMPDCATDYLKLEHLCQSLMAPDDPLWPHAKASVGEAAKLVDEANGKIGESGKQWRRFREVDRIKSEIHSWLAWQPEPGAPLGTAINQKIVGCDSPQALAFLRWMRDLLGFSTLTTI